MHLEILKVSGLGKFYSQSYVPITVLEKVTRRAFSSKSNSAAEAIVL